jgi:general secretion pathway protein E
MVTHQRIGQILKEKFGLSPQRLAEALAVQKEKGDPIGSILSRLHAVKEEAVTEALAAQFGLSYRAEIPARDVDTELVRRLPIGFLKRYELIPLRRNGRAVTVAASNPIHLATLDDLRAIFKSDLEVILAPSRVILHVINQVSESASGTAEQVIEDLGNENLDALASELHEPVDLLEAVDEAPIIRLVNALLSQAVKERASDIHVEPFEREIEIRFRIDGILYKILTPPKRFQSSIVSRIKIMSGLNIAEKRLPQDGRMGIRIAGREIDIRVSVIPTAHGERVVLRLLDKGTRLLDLEEIGLSHDNQRTLDQLIRLAHGIILVTGPTGSGKTTTLYAALSRINSPDKNIITIEDPIEYQLKGIGQMQVNPKIALTFASGLRSILRQDPDVIMVGEIRDVETAEIAIHASLTGHLVFSTLHTNDASGAITRLLDMGIEPFLVSSSLVAIVAQRLIRVLCTQCRKPYTPTPEELEKLGFRGEAIRQAHTMKFHHPVGCPACINTGYRGRTGIFEMLLLTDELRQMILAKTDANTIRARAQQRGMLTLREDGARMIREGITTTEEVLRVTQEEIEEVV